uniref:Ufm1-specific protease (Trinotate prediction) n=1 Tax=Henneguya salminicola TaxID=69463 RepID=A0A6G3MFN4_HENSL
MHIFIMAVNKLKIKFLLLIIFEGWGCAYRSFQTIFSWFVLNGFSSILSIPTINEIQQCLVDIGDKPSSIVNSSNWIGSIEIGMVLEKLLGLKYRIIQIYPGQSISEYIRHIMIHFKQNVSPIMIGGNNLAHTILGVAFDSNTGKCKFLVADPHYFGEDDLEIIISKGWVSWKNENFWKRDQSYNIILPCIEENQ